MSFDVILMAADNSTHVPRKSDLLRAFDGYVLGDRPPISLSALAVLPGYVPRAGDDEPLPVRTLIVGGPGGGECEMSYTWNGDADPEQSLITVREPLRADWFWDGVLQILRQFDLLMVVPGAPDSYAVIARADATVPSGLRDGMQVVEVGSVEQLISVVSSGGPPPRANARDIHGR